MQTRCLPCCVYRVCPAVYLVVCVTLSMIITISTSNVAAAEPSCNANKGRGIQAGPHVHTRKLSALLEKKYLIEAWQ